MFSYGSGAMKPRGEIFMKAMAELCADPLTSLMVGDSVEADMRGAKACGMRTCLYDPDGLSPSDPAIDARIARFGELPAGCP